MSTMWKGEENSAYIYQDLIKLYREREGVGLRGAELSVELVRNYIGLASLHNILYSTK